MKRFLALLLAALMAISLSSCSLLATYKIKEEIEEKIEEETVYIFKTDNFAVDEEMWEYYFQAIYHHLKVVMTEYGGESLLPDPDIPLKEQEYFGGMTWYDYLEEATNTQIRDLLLLCEAANDAGYDFSSEHEGMVEERVSEIKADADSAGMTFNKYLKKTYGCSEETLRETLKLECYANAYAENLTESYGTNDPVEISEKYEQDMQKFSKKYKFLLEPENMPEAEHEHSHETEEHSHG